MEKDKNKHSKENKENKVINMGLNKYKILYELGKGSQGKVYCVEREGTGEYFAMKECKPTQEAANEILAHKNCNCLNIVSIIEANKIEDKIYIIMELGECNLQNYMAGKPDKRLDEQEVFKLIQDVSNGLNIIHKNNFIHHDIKETNIIMNFDLFKIADFGVTTKGEMKTFRGTPHFLAPESLEMKTYMGACDSAIDIWALGVVAFQSCFDMHPIYTKSSKDLDYFKKQIELLVKNGYSFSGFKSALKKDENTRKLKKFEDIEKSLKEKQLLEYFFTRAFTYEPTRRLKLQEIPAILSQVGGRSRQQVVPRFSSQPVLPSYDQNQYASMTLQRFPSYGSSQSIEPQTLVKTAYQPPTPGTQMNPLKASIIQFLANTIQIISVTLAPYPSEANALMTMINQIMMAYRSSNLMQPSIPQQNVIILYRSLINLQRLIPGVFYRILLIAFLAQILRNYQSFVMKMVYISNGEIKSGDFREIQKYGAKVDAVKVNDIGNFLQQHLK